MIDTAGVIDIFGGDVDCVKEMFGLYLEHNVPVIKDIELYYAEDNSEALNHAFHTLSGALSNFLEEELALIQDCEKIAKAGGKPGQEQMNLFYEKMGETTRQIEDFVK